MACGMFLWFSRYYGFYYGFKFMAPTGSFMAQNGSLMAFLLFIASIMAHNGFYRNTSTPMQVLLNTDMVSFFVM